jgi:membrane protease subunit HflK
MILLKIVVCALIVAGIGAWIACGGPIGKRRIIEEMRDEDKDISTKALADFKKYSIPVVIVALLLFGAFDCFYTVKESQNAVVTMFGKVVKVVDAGTHFKIPFVQKVKKLDVSTHGQSLGYEIQDSTQTYGNKENPLMITSDFNLINVDFYMEYKINDPVAFLYSADDPELILTNEAMSSIRAIISDYKVDDVMTTAKGEIQQKIKESISKKLEERQIGLQLINVLIQDVEPPTAEVMDAFKSVETAKQGADTSINNAERYKNEQIPKAEAEADKIKQEAEAKKQSRIAEAEGQVARFEKMYEEYSKYPLITKKRIFYETMEELLPNMKIIISDGSTQTLVPSNLLNMKGE